MPTGRLPEALRRVDEICADDGLRVANVFHAGDGNMHPLILYNVNDPAEQEKAERAGARRADDVASSSAAASPASTASASRSAT